LVTLLLRRRISLNTSQRLRSARNPARKRFQKVTGHEEFQRPQGSEFVGAAR
jgi:hypothetical protein